MPININKGESEEQFISRCIGEEINSGKEQDVATAICYSYWDKDKMSKITNMSEKVMSRVAFDAKYKGINLMAESLDDACWDGYEAIGTKDMDGREVPNCVPIKE